MIKIHLNGDIQEVADPVTLAGLLSRLRINVKKVAVERNFEIVPKSAYGDTDIQDGDRLEIVQFVGGG